MPSPQGFPVLREDGGTLTGAAGQRDTPNGFEVVVDAQFTDIPNIVDAISTKLGNLVGGSIAVLDYLPDGNVSLSRLEAEGLIIENGKTLNGRSSPETFHLSLNDGVWDMAKGDPAATSGLGIGGGIPLLMDGLPFGKVNVYRDGAPAGLPETGDPGTGNTQYLLQRSSAGFGDYDDRGTAVGKVVTALGPDGTVIVMVQEDGTDGPKVSELRDALKQMGATDAVAFDGSASATLVVDGKVEIAPSKFRDNMMTAGLGLRLPLSEAGLTNFVNGNEMYAGTQLAFPDSPAAPPGDYLDDWFTPVPTDVPDDIFNAPEILDWSDLSMGFPGGGDSFAYYGGSPADSFPMPESWDFSSPELQFDNSYDFPGGLDFGNYDFSEYDAFSGLDSMSFGGFEDYTWE
ncbi:phosphodiester glycosidase family protein [Actinoplanes sp. TRM88002]|uniref:Phosphodiester glycosidase family protein n=2 Tax=Paractinoplanes hotanensis TaxID=2906497 RepID=A0ABT0YEJ7_9ACTN|nr:phosphodiester glycosidase family protein [Actinoplanes hotanensis]